MIGNHWRTCSTSSSGPSPFVVVGVASGSSSVVMRSRPSASSPIWPSAISRLERFSSSGSQQRSGCSGAARSRASSAGTCGALSNSCGQRGRKWQPFGAVVQRRRQARDRRQALRPRPVHAGDRAQQAPRVGVLRVVEDLVDRPLLDDAPAVHHERCGRRCRRRRRGRAYEHDARVGALAQLLHDAARICAWIVTSSAVVGSSAISTARVARERHRDHHALAHAAGELVRVAADALPGARDADALEQLDRAVVAPPAEPMSAVRLDLLDDLRRRCAGPGSATSSGPGRSSRSPRPAAAAARRRSRRGGPGPRASPCPRTSCSARGVRPMSVSADTDLPEPDSPTIASTSPERSWKETSSTACTRPSSVRKPTRRCSTSSRSLPFVIESRNPWVERRVDDVHDRVEEDDEERAEQRDREHRRHVEPADGLLEVLADALDVEDGLREDRAAAEHGAEVQAPERDDRDERVAQHVVAEHALLAESLGPRGPHVVVVDRVEHARAQRRASRPR